MNAQSIQRLVKRRRNPLHLRGRGKRFGLKRLYVYTEDVLACCTALGLRRCILGRRKGALLVHFGYGVWLQRTLIFVCDQRMHAMIKDRALQEEVNSQFENGQSALSTGRCRTDSEAKPPGRAARVRARVKRSEHFRANPVKTYSS